ncbi:MAG TPA: GNAT family N-acetyltransferase [Tepidisphaeraceae bacterium]|nr:GNAT family N-acetyltransferase [Tepidisphaeraceae bacterium]
MKLETERLIIRNWKISSRGDIMGAFAMYSDPQVLRYFPPTKQIASMSEMKEVLRQRIERNKTYPPGQGLWCVEERAESRVVGTALLKPLPDGAGNLTAEIEVGWHLRRDAWGKGFATEFGRALLEYGFAELKLAEIFAVVFPSNQQSVRVTQRLGMEPLGPTDKYYGTTTELFRMTADAWRQAI